MKCFGKTTRTAGTGLMMAGAMACSDVSERSGSEARLQEIEAALTGLPDFVPSLQTHQRIGHHGFGETQAEILIDLGSVQIPDRVCVFPVRLPVSGASPSIGFPAAFEITLSADRNFTAPVRLASWKEPAPGAGEAVPFLSFTGNGAAGRFVKLTVTGLREGDRPYFRLGEIVVLAEGRNVALKQAVETGESLQNPRRWEPMNLTDGYLWCLPLRGTADSTTNGFLSGAEMRETDSDHAWVEVDLGASTPIDEIHLVPAHPVELPDSNGFGFPPRFYVIADAGLETERELLREVDPPYPAEGLPNPGSAQVTLALHGITARTIRMQCETLARSGATTDRRRRNLFALSELQVWHRGTNLASGRPVRAGSESLTDRWSPGALTDDQSSRHRLLNWNTWIEGLEQRVALEKERSYLKAASALRQERFRERLIAGSLTAAVIAILLSIVVILSLRRRTEQARESLRTRIARDLHDEIGASLSHLAMQSDLARRQMEAGNLQPGRLDSISATARETLDHMRDIIWLLTPRGGSWEELSDRLESIAGRLLDGSTNEIRVEGTPPEGDPPIEWAREFVSFLKEALTNARKHSRASLITTTVHWGTSLRVEVSDNGVGFDPASTAGGEGLDNLRTRAAILGGKLTIESSGGSGSRIELLADYPD